jgi:hypothetical protein
MNFGYLIIISNTGQHDYFKMAEALCYSIKTTQKPGYDKVAIVVDNLAKILAENETTSMFDHVIEWNEEDFWNGRNWMDKLSPFDFTVCLDADMLFMEDYSTWIDHFIDNCDLYVSNRSYTFKGSIVRENYYRKAFRDNDIPDLYSFYTFFKKNKLICEEFFELGRIILKNPTEFSSLYFSKRKPKILGTDEIFGLSAKILGIEDKIAYPLAFPRVTHLKPMIQNWGLKAEKVSDIVGFYLNDKGKMKIGTHQQHNIIHYVEKDFISDEVLNIFRNRYYGNIDD